MPNGPTPEVIPEPVGDPLPSKPEPQSDPKPDPRPIQVPQATQQDPHPPPGDRAGAGARWDSVRANQASDAIATNEQAGGME